MINSMFLWLHSFDSKEVSHCGKKRFSLTGTSSTSSIGVPIPKEAYTRIFYYSDIGYQESVLVDRKLNPLGEIG